MSNPKSRLKQVSSHIAPKPADWSDISTQLSDIRRLAAEPPVNTTGYKRQVQRGKLWVRDRINKLLDEGSFVEIGSATGYVTWDSTGEKVEEFLPTNNLQGKGTINKRRVFLTADDFTVRAGHADGAIMAKTIYVEKLSLDLRLPIIKLVDGSSGGGSVTTTKAAGHTLLPSLYSFFGIVAEQLNAGIPNIAALLGPCIGLGATRAAMCHFSVIASDVGFLFAAGPKVVEHATFEEGLSFRDLGGAEVHCANGTIDNLALNEADCFAQIRRFLSYVPDSGYNIPPTTECSDPADRKCPELRTLVPRRTQRAVDIYPLLNTLPDAGSFFELGRLFSATAIVGLARIAGHPVGVIANQHSSALDVAGCQKIAKHLKLCDVFNLPVVQFIDCAGFAVGSAAERAGTMKWGVEMAKAYYDTSVPIYSVVVRRCFGVAGGIMVDPRDMKHRIFWPSGEFGSLPADGGGIEAAHAAELGEAMKVGGEEAKQRRLKELMREYELLANPVRAANKWGIEDMVEPEDTRGVVAEWVMRMYEENLKVRVERRRAGVLKTSFR